MRCSACSMRAQPLPLRLDGVASMPAIRAVEVALAIRITEYCARFR